MNWCQHISHSFKNARTKVHAQKLNFNFCRNVSLPGFFFWNTLYITIVARIRAICSRLEKRVVYFKTSHLSLRLPTFFMVTVLVSDSQICCVSYNKEQAINIVQNQMQPGIGFIIYLMFCLWPDGWGLMVRWLLCLPLCYSLVCRYAIKS